jgi:hypothetical protein
MQNLTVSLPSVAIARLTAAVASLSGTRFVGVTYRSKESNELARHVLIVGASYENVVKESIEKLARMRGAELGVDMQATKALTDSIANAKAKVEMFNAMAFGSPNYNEVAHDEWHVALDSTKRALKNLQNMIGPERAAASELALSLFQSLTGENLAYTKGGVYETICQGVKVSRVDGSFELCGLSHSKKVLEQGVFKSVASSPKTIAKNKLRSELPISKFRTLALDMGALESVRIGGQEIDVLDIV